MIVTHKIDMDFASKNENAAVPQIRVVQGDCNTRMVELMLYADRTVWNIPEGTDVQIRYRKPDGTGGVYDTMPDGVQAWSISGNAVSVLLAPQVLTVAGVVRSQIALVLNEKFLATFEVRIIVEEDPSVGALKSEDYTNLQTWMTEKIHSILSAAMGSGVFDGATFVPMVSSSGELSWTNNRGLENPATVNINAPQGILPVVNGGTGSNNAAVARANLGAAPAGFGLGNDSQPVDSFDNIIATGMYNGILNLGQPSTENGWTCLHIGGKDYAVQNCWQILATGVLQVSRTKNAGVWNEWEWVNPPMVLGIGYRTTERHKGKPVYLQLLNFGALPDNSTKTIYATATGISKIISYEGIYRSSDGGGALIDASGEVRSNFHVTTNQFSFSITAPANSSGYTAEVLIKYVK